MWNVSPPTARGIRDRVREMRFPAALCKSRCVAVLLRKIPLHTVVWRYRSPFLFFFFAASNAVPSFVNIASVVSPVFETILFSNYLVHRI